MAGWHHAREEHFHPMKASRAVRPGEVAEPRHRATKHERTGREPEHRERVGREDQEHVGRHPSAAGIESAAKITSVVSMTTSTPAAGRGEPAVQPGQEPPAVVVLADRHDPAQRADEAVPVSTCTPPRAIRSAATIQPAEHVVRSAARSVARREAPQHGGAGTAANSTRCWWRRYGERLEQQREHEDLSMLSADPTRYGEVPCPAAPPPRADAAGGGRATTALTSTARRIVGWPGSSPGQRPAGRGSRPQPPPAHPGVRVMPSIPPSGPARPLGAPGRGGVPPHRCAPGSGRAVACCGARPRHAVPPRSAR